MVWYVIMISCGCDVVHGYDTLVQLKALRGCRMWIPSDAVPLRGSGPWAAARTQGLLALLS